MTCPRPHRPRTPWLYSPGAQPWPWTLANTTTPRILSPDLSTLSRADTQTLVMSPPWQETQRGPGGGDSTQKGWLGHLWASLGGHEEVQPAKPGTGIPQNRKLPPSALQSRPRLPASSCWRSRCKLWNLFGGLNMLLLIEHVSPLAQTFECVSLWTCFSKQQMCQKQVGKERKSQQRKGKRKRESFKIEIEDIKKNQRKI